ncbi:purine-nucleoside phosphorylase, partial [Bacteriovoracaceae bacterium]|nr:purine-nucleoside phosphorylase [Bacteriovoracaceae bacterium]
EATDFLKKEILQNSSNVKNAIILGSGLGFFADHFEDKKSVSYEEIPHFHVPKVEGHKGNLVLGKVNGIEVMAMQGRYHFYEGHSPLDIALPIRVFKQLGIENLIVTNAAGGINEQYTPGDLVYIKDHLNLTGSNPLLGPNFSEFGVRFPDMTNAYNKELISCIELAASKLKMNIRGGIYAGLTGPCYETPAEIRMLKTIGSDLVGMSTVMEIIAGNHAGLKCAGISCVTNLAAGISKQKLNHDEVKETADRSRDKFVALLTEILKQIKI